MHNAVEVIWNTKCGSLLIGPLFEVMLFVLLDIFEMDSHIFVSVRAGVGVVNPSTVGRDLSTREVFAPGPLEGRLTAGGAGWQAPW